MLVTMSNLVNESYKYIINKGKIKRMLSENSAEKLYKVEGLLVTNNDLLFQKEIISDIRAITGITTVDAREYIPNLPKKENSYNKISILTAIIQILFFQM